jgi:hypothetical protein
MCFHGAWVIFFRAFAVYSGRLDDALLVVLGAEKDGGGERVEISRSVSFDEQDRALKLDTYCIATHDGATHYGGIAAWSVESGFVTLQLTPEACRVLGVDGGFEIGVPRESTDSLREWLARIIDAK